MAEPDLHQSAWARGWSDTMRWLHSFWFWGFEVFVAGAIGIITEDPWAALIVVAAMLILLFAVATIAAPVRQRDEARRTLRERPAIKQDDNRTHQYERFSAWYAMVNEIEDEFGSEAESLEIRPTIRRRTEYYQMKPYLSPETIQDVERSMAFSIRSRIIAGRQQTDTEQLLSRLRSDIAAAEQKEKYGSE